MTISRGDVVLVLFPFADLTGAKKRPALVVQADGLATGLPQRIVAQITSNTARTGQTRVHITKSSPLGQQMGLLTDSVVVADNLATVVEREIYKVIGRCTAMHLVEAALKATLGL